MQGENSKQEKKKEHHHRLSRKISRRFINGLILLVPLAITFFVIVETLNFTEGVLGKHLPCYFPGMGLITLLLIIYLAGWASSYWATRRLIRLGEKLLGKIPVVKFIYNSVKHLSTAVFESNNMFDHVVLVPFHQSKALGFIMADVPQVLKEQLGDVLKTLTPREAKVLKLRFGLDDGRQRTLEEVGKEFDVTRERIRQIEAKALRKLRHPSRSKKLKDFLDN